MSVEQLPELGVVVGSDSDPDRPRYGGTRYDSHAPLHWRGLHEGARRAREIADAFSDDAGMPLRITWCVRSDAQMAELYGDAAWAFGEFADFWQSVQAGGDEVAWHPHLWRWDGGDGCWYQEIEDVPWIEDCLMGGYEALADSLGRPPRTSRMGWEFHNNATMRTLRNLAIEVDFSAIPGRFTPGAPDRDGSAFACHMDWRGAPEEPYVPAESDYRRPADNGESGPVELPMSVFRSPALAAAAALRRISRRPLAQTVGQLLRVSEPLKAYITSHPQVFGRLAAGRVERARRTRGELLVTAFHPDELLGDYSGAANNAGHFRTNLERLVVLARRRRVRLRFLTAGEAVHWVKARDAAADDVQQGSSRCGAGALGWEPVLLTSDEGGE